MKRKIVLASHGGLASGLYDTAKMIVGKLPFDVEIYSLQPGGLAEDYGRKLKKEIVAHMNTEYVILTDLYGASVFTAMYLCTKLDNVRLFSGMNLNMLLSVCLEHPAPLNETDIEQILHDAKSGIQFTQQSKECEREEF